MAKRSAQFEIVDARTTFVVGSEDELQATVVNLARGRGWWVFFFPGWAFRLAMMSMKRGRKSGRQWPDKGWPDCVFLKPETFDLVIAEFKFRKNTPQVEQNIWLTALRRYGIPVYVWTERDKLTIERILS